MSLSAGEQLCVVVQLKQQQTQLALLWLLLLDDVEDAEDLI